MATAHASRESDGQITECSVQFTAMPVGPVSRTDAEQFRVFVAPTSTELRRSGAWRWWQKGSRETQINSHYCDDFLLHASHKETTELRRINDFLHHTKNKSPAHDAVGVKDERCHLLFGRFLDMVLCPLEQLATRLRHHERRSGTVDTHRPEGLGRTVTSARPPLEICH